MEDVIMSYECAHYLNLEKRHQDAANALLGNEVTACGGFSKDQMAMLLYNQSLAHDEETRNLPRALLYEIAASFSAPYLFNTKVMIHPQGLIHYCRHSSESPNKKVYWSQEVFAHSHHSYFNKASIKELVSVAEKDFFKKVLSSAQKKTVENLNVDEILTELPDGEKYILLPIHSGILGKNRTTKLTDTLHIVNLDLPYEVYMCSYIPENSILVGSKRHEAGFVLSPYMLAIKDTYRDLFKMQVSGSMLYEGSEFYILITQ